MIDGILDAARVVLAWLGLVEIDPTYSGESLPGVAFDVGNDV